MSLRAIAFACALIMLITGIFGSRPIFNGVRYVLGGHPVPTTRGIPSTTSLPQSRATARAGRAPIEPRVQRTSSLLPTSSVVAGNARRVVTPGVPSRVPGEPHRRSSEGAAPRVALPSMPAPSISTGINALPTTQPVPTATASSSSVALINYWVASVRAHRGHTVSLVYVIDNDTGTTARLWLGASIKRPAVRSWTTTAISDPLHDIVVFVPPGTSVQVRHFTLAHAIRPGTYDVAWGVRDPETGRRIALVAAPHALQVLS